MKKLSFVITVFLVQMIYQAQTLRYISDMRGVVDNKGTTHIFYRIYEETKESNQTIIRNPVFHLNMSTMSDTLLIDDYQIISAKGTEGRKVNDYQFIENNPGQYVYGGIENGKGFIKVYNIDNASYFTHGPVTCIQVSNENPDLIFFSMMALFYSTDRGKTWDFKNNWYTGKFVINPYNNSHIYRIGYNELYGYNPLEKSVDGGKTFNLISDWIYFTSFDDYFIMQFDADNQHVYLTTQNKNDYQVFYNLFVSTDNGNSFDFRNDDAQNITAPVQGNPGNLWSSNGNELIYSYDSFENFQIKAFANREIKKIYSHIDGQTAFIATCSDIYQFANNNLESVKHLNNGDAAEQFYPLNLGNCWVYKMNYYENYVPQISFQKIVALKDTLISGIQYRDLHQVSSNSYVWHSLIRHDSTTGFLVYYNGHEPEEFCFDFDAQINDRIYRPESDGSYTSLWTFISEKPEKYFNNEFVFREYSGNWWNESRTYAKNIGLIGRGFVEFGYGYTFSLIGCVIDGVVYGDTTFTITDIGDDIKQNYDYRLAQNYPNPFNPSTIINWQIEKSGNVKLVLYDVLGREVATLVDEFQIAGSHKYELNTQNYSLPSGVYFYRLTSGNFSETKKMILLR